MSSPVCQSDVSASGSYPMSLTQYLIAQRRRFPQASGNFNALLLDIAMACKRMSHRVSMGELHPGASSMSQDEWADAIQIPHSCGTGRYFVFFQAIDKPRPLEVNGTVGSVFSIVRSAIEFKDPVICPSRSLIEEHRGEMVASGYAIYGPATLLILSVGQGVVCFTLDPNFGEFVMTRPAVRIPAQTNEFAVNASNRRYWPRPIQRYVDECLAGRNGPRSADFNMRWMGSVVADAHRILLQGGICIYPRDQEDVSKTGQVHTGFIAQPIAFLIEQAGGRASNGYQSVDDAANAFDERMPLVFGSREEVERIERYFTDTHAGSTDIPLFGERSLFRDWAVPTAESTQCFLE